MSSGTDKGDCTKAVMADMQVCCEAPECAAFNNYNNSDLNLTVGA